MRTRFNITIKFMYKGCKIGAIWNWIEDEDMIDPPNDLHFLHPLTNSKCELIEQCLTGWSEQDSEEQQKWERLIEFIESRNDLWNTITNEIQLWEDTTQYEAEVIVAFDDKGDYHIKITRERRYKMMLECFIEFGGFYGSIHSAIIESQCYDAAYEFLENRGLPTEIADELSCELLSAIWKDATRKYAKLLVERINSNLETKFRLVDVNSPTDYNYGTDILDVVADSLEDAKGVIDKINKCPKEFYQYVEWLTTPSPGYIPYYDFEDLFRAKDNTILLTREDALQNVPTISWELVKQLDQPETLISFGLGFYNKQYEIIPDFSIWDGDWDVTGILENCLKEIDIVRHYEHKASNLVELINELYQTYREHDDYFEARYSLISELTRRVIPDKSGNKQWEYAKKLLESSGFTNILDEIRKHENKIDAERLVRSFMEKIFPRYDHWVKVTEGGIYAYGKL